jgi:cell division protein FtsA
MIMANQSIFTGLDIGTSKIRCICGRINDGSFEILAYSERDTGGVKKGIIQHSTEVSREIKGIIDEVQLTSGAVIKNITVNVNGAHVHGMNSKGVIAISALNHEITESDRMRVEEAASTMQMPPNREILKAFAKNYRLDGQDNIKDPVGMNGVRLEVETHILTASTPSVRILEETIHEAGLFAEHKIVSGLAIAESCLTRQQKESGACVVDIGASTTNITVIEDGEIELVSVIPVGGNNITNDLAIGLRCDLVVAEKIKLSYPGFGNEQQKPIISVVDGGQKYNYETSKVQMIIESRVEELFELVDAELKKIKRSQKLPGGIIIAGGTSLMINIDELAKSVLKLPVSKAKINSILTGLVEGIQDDPRKLTVIGLLQMSYLLGESNFNIAGEKNFLKITGMPNAIKRLFKRN